MTINRVDLRRDKTGDSVFRVIVNHWSQAPETGKWLTTGMVDVFDVTSKEEAGRIARGLRAAGREITICSNAGDDVAYASLNSRRLVWKRKR